MTKIREIIEKYVRKHKVYQSAIFAEDFNKLEKELLSYIKGIEEVNFAAGCKYQIDELNEEKKALEEK